MFEIDWRSLILPFAYVAVLGGTFMTFSTIYRKRKAGETPRRLCAIVLSY
jgi:translocation protein SEC66